MQTDVGLKKKKDSIPVGRNMESSTEIRNMGEIIKERAN
jgi:hypothetical protein